MKKLLSIVLSLIMVIGTLAFASTEPSYAASKTPAKVTGLSVKQISDTTVKLTYMYKHSKC